jgi:hypothetical protein
MRKKAIVSILVCMLVIPSFIVSAERIDITKASTNYDDDVPIWENGDSWTYTVSEFWVDFTFEGKNIQMVGIIDDFTWTVSDTSGSTYTVDVTGKITATYEISIPIGSLVLYVNGTINSPWNRLKGTIIFGKSNLEIEDFNVVITGFTSIKIYPLPIKFPILIRITADAEFSTPVPLFDFPLHNFKFWNLPEIDITTDVNVGGIFGIFKIPMTIYTHYGWTPLAFSCLYQESITVEAGIFDAWKIKSLIGGFFEYYYAPSVGNLVKIDVNMPHGGIEAELKTTNYDHV